MSDPERGWGEQTAPTAASSDALWDRLWKIAGERTEGGRYIPQGEKLNPGYIDGNETKRKP